MSDGKIDNDMSEKIEPSDENLEERSDESAVDVSEDLHDAEVPADVINEEEAYDTDLETDEPGGKPYKSMTAEDVYVKACELCGVVPASYFVAHMFEEVMDMSHHGLGPNGIKAIATPLVVNTSIVDLNLEDNWITSEGMKDITDMLMENCYISSLNIAGNKLATDGARFVCEMIQENTNLRELNLSRNDFKDSDAQYFAEALRQNFRLKHLNLSGNLFCELGGEWLGQAIVNNEAVEHLNLSWNHLRRRGALAICAGMKSNITIKYLDLSWNGFADDGAMAMGVALKSNNSLTWLDLSNNRISDKGASMLAKGLEINDTLKTLKIGSNPMGSHGALALLRAMMKNENSAMEELDIKGVQVNEEFLKLAQEMKDKVAASGGSKTSFFLTMNPIDVTSQTKPKPPAQASSDDPMQILQKFLEDKRLRLVDLFRNFDKDLSWKISPAEFKKGIVDSGISLSSAQLAGLMKNLDIDTDGQVNYSEFLTGKKEAILRRREMLRNEAKMKAQIKERKKSEAEKFMSAWQDAVRASVTPGSSLRPTPNHTPLRSRSLVVPIQEAANQPQNDIISQATAKLRGEKIVPLISKSFVETSDRLGRKMDSSFYSSQTSFENYPPISRNSSDFVELSIDVPVAKLTSQSVVDTNASSQPEEFEQLRRTPGTPNSRKTPFKVNSKK